MLTRYAAILASESAADEASWRAVCASISAMASEIEVWGVVSSVVFFAGAPDLARAVAVLPGVRDVRETTEDQMRFVATLDHTALLADVHARTSRPNGLELGVAASTLVDGRPPYPTLSATADGIVWSSDPTVDLPTRLCVVGAINVSIQSTSRSPYDDTHPVAAAMSDVARHLPVVVAAGNVDFDPDPTMFGWALNPAVVSVGATDAAGLRLLTCSRIGSPEAGTGPTIVACGIDETGVEGTSYAAPVVTTQFALLAASILAVRSAVRSSSAYPEGVPLAARCFVDVGRANDPGSHAFKVADFAARPRKLPALPREVADADVAATLVGTPIAAALDRLPSAALLIAALRASARPVPGQARHEVGAGFVSDATTADYVRGLTTAGLAELLTVPFAGPDQPLFDGALVDAFLEGARDSMIGWQRGIDDTAPAGVEFVEPRPT